MGVKLRDKHHTVSIIPARGNSKEIKNKNMIDLCGKPLISYVLETCLDCDEIDLVVVTSDSSEIISLVSSLFQDKVKCIKRPDSLATDSSVSEDALVHALCQLSSEGIFPQRAIFVQATSPLTTSYDLSRLLIKLNQYDSCAFYVEDYGFFFNEDDMKVARLPRQERLPRYREAGNAWSFHVDGFLREKTRLFGKMGLCKIDYPRNLEIDTDSDLTLIKYILEANKL